MPFTLRRIFDTLCVVSLTGAALCLPYWCAAQEQPVLDLNAYEGQVVLLDFWASWCGPCRESFPWMSETEKKYHDKGFAVLGVNLDKDAASAEDFLRRFPAEFKIIFDATGAIAEQYHLMAMPSSFLIDRTGHVRYKHLGFRQDKRADYEAELQTLLSEK